VVQPVVRPIGNMAATKFVEEDRLRTGSIEVEAKRTSVRSLGHDIRRKM
jgi:hypothetical protein